jgi:hypothetical protein
MLQCILFMDNKDIFLKCCCQVHMINIMRDIHGSGNVGW